jgi:valyl-tRNA synthetase
MATPNDRPALDKAYDPHAIEIRLYESWEQAGYFRPAGQGPGYCIMIPPPNVTGSLHMGHAFQDTIMDSLIRYHRMRGDNTLWQAGTDHAGIATQMVVERQLAAEGKSRHDLGRDTFIKRVWEWKEHSGGTITKQLRRMGASLDWSRERFTMDEGLSKAVTDVFVRLYHEDLIYRGKRLVNWDPVLHTAVSDLEVVSEEESGSLWHIRYPLADGSGHLVVATTRPETMLGDSAIAVHPEDDRYRHLVGKRVLLPITNREIPVIADEYVDREFGSGCVKITPAHDFNDYEVGKRHQLPLFNIFTPDAKIVSDTDWPMAKEGFRPVKAANRDNVIDLASDIGIPSDYWGLDRYDARKKIVADLDAAGLLAEVKPHKLMVPRGDRTNAVIEPYLTDQWYVRVAPLAAEAIKVVEDGRIKFVPENWTKTYYEWMRNIQDWCISRQIWWGHRIPAWYDDQGSIYVAASEAEARAQAMAKHGKEVALTQDEDVLDTWFSSALWPFSTLGWPAQTAELKAFYPTSVLVTGFDIIFFWVARMIMMGLKFAGDVPFREVYIHGLVRDAHGQKMSKSKGNVLDPLDLIDGIDLETLVRKRTTGLMQPQMAKKIEQATRKEFAGGIPAYGTDALRFTFASLATQGRDIKFDLGRVEGYRNFCNKLWNAARYVLMNTEGQDCGQNGGDIRLSVADAWIRSRLQQVAAEVESGFAGYRFDLASHAIYSFIWDEYCSWYLELSKRQLAVGQLADDPATAAALRGTRQTLVQILEASLRLLHPLMPFITEEIWQRVAPLAGRSGPSIMLQPYPRSKPDEIDHGALAEMDWVQKFINGIRNIRGEYNVSPAQVLQECLIEDASDGDRDNLRKHELLLTGGLTAGSLTKVASLRILAPDTTPPPSAMFLLDQMKVHVPLGALINKQDELARLAKEMERLEKEIAKARGKLANQDFVARAPAQVVEQEKGRVQEFESALAKLGTQRASVAALPD